LCSCSKIPNKSIFEELSTKELSQAIESNSPFADVDRGLCVVAELYPVIKAEYNDITYKRMFEYNKLTRIL